MNFTTAGQYRLLTIPPEISSLVWEYLMPYDLCICMTLCRALNSYLKSDQFWKHHTFRVMEYRYDKPEYVPFSKNYIYQIHRSDLYNTPWSDDLSFFKRYKRVLKLTGYQYIFYDADTGQITTPLSAFAQWNPDGVYMDIDIPPRLCIHAVQSDIIYSKVSDNNHPTSLCKRGTGSLTHEDKPNSSYHYLLRFKRITALVRDMSDAVDVIRRHNIRISYRRYNTVDGAPFENEITRHRHLNALPWKCLTCKSVYGPGSYVYIVHYQWTKCPICKTNTSNINRIEYCSCKNCKKFASNHINSGIQKIVKRCRKCKLVTDRIASTTQYI